MEQIETTEKIIIRPTYQQLALVACCFGGSSFWEGFRTAFLEADGPLDHWKAVKCGLLAAELEESSWDDFARAHLPYPNIPRVGRRAWIYTSHSRSTVVTVKEPSRVRAAWGDLPSVTVSCYEGWNFHQRWLEELEQSR